MPNVTALMFASSNGDVESVVSLLALNDIKENAGAVTPEGNTALMLASRWGHAEIVTALLACPTVATSANAVDEDGNNALMIASSRGFNSVVVALSHQRMLSTKRATPHSF
jgi:hypothetical protein